MFVQDLSGVQNLQKKHDLLEGDIITKQDRIDVCSTQADLFSEQEHFDAPTIVAKKAALMERYEKLKVSFLLVVVNI